MTTISKTEHRDADASGKPGRDCPLCPRLKAFREEWRRREAQWFNAPVASFGPRSARLLIVGLAPGLRGANRTGRPFTGDASGDFLYPALYRAGFASQPNATDRNDGLRLIDCFITAAVRCAPPANKPTPEEMRNCFPYLVEEFEALSRLRVAIGLGSIGFAAILRALLQLGYALDPQRPKFGHGVEVHATNGARRILVIASYHPSRQNTNTGVLTQKMFDAIFSRASRALSSGTR